MRRAAAAVLCMTALLFAFANLCEASDVSFDLSDLTLDGRITSEYTSRWSDNNDDHDLFTTLYLNLKQKEESTLSATALGTFNWDIGGTDNRRSAFFDIYDTYDRDFQGRLYLLYLDVDDVLHEDSRLRLGRQYVFSTDVIRFDGAKYEGNLTNDFKFYVFGGTRTSFYSNLHDEGYAVGTGLQYFPAKWTKFGLDYARVDDEFANDSLSVSLTQRISPVLQIGARSRFLDDEFRDVRVRTRVDIQKIDLSAVAAYFRQGETLRQFANEFSSYFRVLGDYHPFEQYGIVLYKGLGENYTLSAGGERREVLDSSDAGPLNREFERYFASIAGDKILNTPLRGNVSFEYWDTDSRDRVTTVSAETGITTLQDKLDLDVGTEYAAYKYDLLRQDERADVRTYFAQARYKYRKSSSISFRFEGETNEFEDDPYFTARLKWSVSF